MDSVKCKAMQILGCFTEIVNDLIQPIACRSFGCSMSFLATMVCHRIGKARTTGIESSIPDRSVPL